MLQSARYCQPVVRSAGQIWRSRWRRCYSTTDETSRNHDPLKILFCGADDFSIHSLRALHILQQQQPFEIDSISVICKTDKQTDRGLKKTQAVPIKAVATELGLPIHQIDSWGSWYRNWWADKSYNLVVAVSFGLLVPAGVLDKAKYGGLNVHPSLLPDLRGSAPITRALLMRRKVTGVSLQTMHPTRFDHGVVLGQSEEVDVGSGSTTESLIQRLGPMGAELLCKGIGKEVFVPPLKDVREGMSEPAKLDLAPKITPRDRQIDWKSWTADEILLRNHVLGDLWDDNTFARCQAPSSTEDSGKRITFHGPWSKMASEAEDNAPAGEPQLVLGPFRKGLTMGVKTVDGFVIVPESLTIEGKRKGKGLQALNEQLRLRRKGHSYAPPSGDVHK